MFDDDVLVYKPQGAIKDIWKSDDRVVCAYGPAGTGKTRGILEKLHYICDNFPKVRVLICRQTRDSLNESVLETFENEVLPDDHPAKTDVQRRMRPKYVYPNGSEIVLGGLDKPKKILSSRYDIIFIGEAIEAEEEAMQTLLTRLRGNAFKYRQLILDTNPGGFDHWIYQANLHGRLRFIKTSHQDNPRYWDEDKEEWTEEGNEYVQGTLAMLTGHMRQKYYIGEWGYSAGLVYSDFDSERNVIPPHPLPLDTYVFYAGVDFGFNDPFVFSVFAYNTKTMDLILVKEIYFSRRLIEDHIITIKRMLESLGNPRIKKMVTDWAKQEAHQLARALDIPRVAADKKSIQHNIDNLSLLLQQAGSDKPGFYIFEDSLYEKDEFLSKEKKHPTCTKEEFPRYSWKKDVTGTMILDVPIDKFNHGINAAEYVSKYTHGKTLFRIRARWR